MKLHDLTGLDAFAEVARRRSFRAAAAARGVSASTLSLTVRELEARLGVRLLNRTTRSVAPTEAGAKLLERLNPALADIEAAVAEALETEGSPAGVLRINAPEPAVELFLAPLLSSFLLAYPRVSVEVTAESRLVDIVAEGFHAGVRWDESLAQDMVAVPLGAEQRYMLVAAPGLLEAVGAPFEPRDLLSRPCLRVRFPSGAMLPWEFERDGRVLRIDPPARAATNSIALQLAAARAGAGFLLAFDGYVAEDVRAGRLVSLLEDWLPAFPAPFLYYPSRRQVPGALRAFVDHVRERTRAIRRSTLNPN